MFAASFRKSVLDLFGWLSPRWRRETEERLFRYAMECAPDSVLVATRKRAVYINARGVAMLGASSSEEVYARDIVDFIHADSLAENEERLRGVFERGEVQVPRVKKMRKSDGAIFEMEVTSGPIVWNGERAAIIFCRDIAERRVLEEKIRHVQKLEAVGLLAGGVAHEFNNILAVLMLNIECLMQDGAASASQREALKQMEFSSTRAAHLVQQLLLFGQRAPLPMASCDLAGIVTGVAQRLRGLFTGEGEGKVDVDCDFDGALPPVLGNARMIEQMLMDLAFNARDAMPRGGMLTFTCARRTFTETDVVRKPGRKLGDYVRLAVSDTGVGMDEAALARIFDPFFTTKEIGKGTGLGLSMVYGIVRQHGGWMEVESEVGMGATFAIYLPTCGE